MTEERQLDKLRKDFIANVSHELRTPISMMQGYSEAIIDDIAETAEEGLQLILETYELEEYSFVIDSTPSNFVYQYDFYMDSPDGEHANLVHIFQYDATGKALFQLDLLTGKWH